MTTKASTHPTKGTRSGASLVGSRSLVCLVHVDYCSCRRGSPTRWLPRLFAHKTHIFVAPTTADNSQISQPIHRQFSPATGPKPLAIPTLSHASLSSTHSQHRSPICRVKGRRNLSRRKKRQPPDSPEVQQLRSPSSIRPESVSLTRNNNIQCPASVGCVLYYFHHPSVQYNLLNFLIFLFLILFKGKIWGFDCVLLVIVYWLIGLIILGFVTLKIWMYTRC